MTAPAGSIAALDDKDAVRVLALVLDHQGRLPDGPTLRQKEAAARQAAADPELSDLADLATDGSHGELARAALTHLVTSRPELSPVLERAISLPGDVTRFDPATLAIGGLVLIALQTELKLSRNESGQWRFALHKKPMRDSTLGRVLGKLIGMYGTSSN